MYAIAQIIYGLPLVANYGEESPKENFEVLAKAVEGKNEGFLSYYSGTADEKPAAFGVELGEFDEVCAYIDVSSLPLSPTPEQLERYAKLLESQSQEVRTALESLGKPKVFFLWSTS